MRPSSIISILFLLIVGLMGCQGDPCEGSNCTNGGVCLDGTCQCPDQFTGRDCNEQATPDKLHVRGIALTRFPLTNNSMTWDEVDGPDLYFRIIEEDYPLAQPIIPIENASGSDMQYFFIESFDMRHPTEPHLIELYDYDGAGIPAQKLGSVVFTPYHSTNGFPETITIDDGGPVAFVMTLEYKYNR